MKTFVSIYLIILLIIIIILMIYNTIYNSRKYMKIKIPFDTFMRDYAIHPRKWIIGIDSVCFLFNDETIEYHFSFFDTIKYHRFYRQKKKIEINEKRKKALDKLCEEINN